jgi:MoaA/NifB/PqqE/SkfB family radical SAM enzyme
LGIHYHLGFAGRNQGHCLENANRSLFVGSDGGVSPCVFTNFPVSSTPAGIWPVKRPYRKTVFGNVTEDRLATIWGRTDYVNLRQAFPDGPLQDLCVGCPKLR